MQPGDWCLRAIPLAAGHHRLRLEYAPLGFRLGRWVSLTFLLVFCSLVVMTVRRFIRRGGLERARASLRMQPEGRGVPAGERREESQVPEGERALFALPVSLAAVALLAFWPIVGRDFLGYGDTVVPVVGLLFLLGWGAWNLARRWRHHSWRQSALAVTILILVATLAHRQIGYSTAAKASSNRPFAAASSDGPSLDKVGEALLRQGLLDEAIGHFQEMLKTNAALPTVQQNLAVALLRKGREDEAIIHFHTAVQLNPRLASAHNSLASLLLQRGQFEEAIAHYQAAIQAQPANPAYLNNLAWVLATCPQDSVRKGARAVELAQEADRLSGGKNPAVLGTLAAAYAEAGRLPQAITTAQRALEMATAQTNSVQHESLR